MKKYLLFAGAVVGGALVGALINGFLVYLGPKLIPPPSGFDLTTLEGLRQAMPHMAPRHFIFPFLAHALGTFLGAAVSSLMVRGQSLWPAMIVGLLFLLGGIVNVVTLPAPAWFSAADLLLAYIPPAFLAGLGVCRLTKKRAPST